MSLGKVISELTKNPLGKDTQTRIDLFVKLKRESDETERQLELLKEQLTEDLLNVYKGESEFRGSGDNKIQFIISDKTGVYPLKTKVLSVIRNEGLSSSIEEVSQVNTKKLSDPRFYDMIKEAVDRAVKKGEISQEEADDFFYDEHRIKKGSLEKITDKIGYVKAKEILDNNMTVSIKVG